MEHVRIVFGQIREKRIPAEKYGARETEHTIIHGKAQVDAVATVQENDKMCKCITDVDLIYICCLN